MKSRILATLFGLSLAGTARAEPIDVGTPAPVVSSIDQDGKPVALADLYAKGPVLVFFYPKADTPGCTAQACSLRDEFETLTDKGVRVVGVSTDSVAAQKAFKEKHNLPYTLLADENKAVINGFGVPTGMMGFASRQAFLVKDGVVVWRDLKASTRQQAADVLAALETLKTSGGA
jgi:peroxiredoxin Q/BCP